MPEVTNADRSEWALEAVQGFVSATRVDTARDAIADLVTDLLHLARARQLDTDQIIENAVALFEEEVTKNADGDISAVRSRFRQLLPDDC